MRERHGRKMKRWLTGVVVCIFWLSVWAAAAGRIGKSFLFAGPLETLKAFAGMLEAPQALLALLSTFWHVTAGFGVALAAGVLLAVAANALVWVRWLLTPLIRFAKSVPVAAFSVLALLWFGSSRLSVVISVLIALPVIYSNVLTGLLERDTGLLEMADVYRIPFWKRVWAIDRPAVYPYLYAACKTAYGMCWKAGIAAEIIAIAEGTVGAQLYLAKIYLQTAELFVWIFLIAAASSLCERLLLRLLGLLGKDCYDSDQ